MKIETLAVHGGYTPDPTTKAVAVPIYQTVAYAFDNTQHGADLFDLKVAGNIYTPHHEPDQRGAGSAHGRARRRHGGAGRGLGHGGDYLRHPDHRRGRRQHRLGLPRCTAAPTTCLPTPFRRWASRCALPTRATRHRSRALIDARTKAVFCESVGNPLGNVTDIAALAEVAHAARRAADRRQHRAQPLPVPPVRARRRHRGAFADQIPGRPRHHAWAAPSSTAANSRGPSTRRASSA